MEYALKCLRCAEAHRREKPMISTIPHPECGTDYGEAGQVVASAMGHLDEALSVGQRNRAINAYTALQAGVASMGAYMHAAGYYHPTPAEVWLRKLLDAAQAMVERPGVETLLAFNNAAEAANRST